MYQQYDNAVQTVLDYLIEQGFCRTPRMDFRRATREFRQYLADKGLEYSHVHAQSWVNTLESDLPRNSFLSLRRSLTLVDYAARNGFVTSVRFSYGDVLPKYRVPECYRELLDAYIERRRQDGNQPSTIQMDSTACTWFLLFLESKNIVNVAFITPEIVKDYHAQAEHRTAEGKNAYTYRIRGFVKFLGMRKLVPETLQFAFATEKATRVSIVTTLSKEQVDTIRTFSKNSSSPPELRSAAVTVLALRMGLRSVDICNLRLSDISWKSRTISIVQQKTGAPLTLPFPIEVGNILTRYILEGRPKCDVPNVFIALKRPYTRLRSRRCCYISSLAILGTKKTATDVRGLHVARRTFASNLLAAGNNVSIIASTLGHAGESTVDEYLATDGQRMRQCSIGLAGIEIGAALK
jgi:site-specific recombinase XerD